MARLLAALAALALGATALPASAIEPPALAPSGILVPISDRVEGLQWAVGGKSAIAGFGTGNTNFGAGRIAPDGDNTGNTSWFEGYLLPATRFVFGGRGFGSFYGTAAGVFTLTRGEGDAAGFTASPNWDADVEELFLGWNSGDLLHPRNSVDLSLALAPRVEALRRRLDVLRGELAPRAELPQALSEEERERLRALGYASEAPGAATAP